MEDFDWTKRGYLRADPAFQRAKTLCNELRDANKANWNNPPSSPATVRRKRRERMIRWVTKCTELGFLTPIEVVPEEVVSFEFDIIAHHDEYPEWIWERSV